MEKHKRKQPYYKIWIDIEMYDPNTDSYTTLGSPGGATAVFFSYKNALAFANKLGAAADTLYAERNKRSASNLLDGRPASGTPGDSKPRQPAVS